MILAIDPGNEKSAFVTLGCDLKPIEFEIISNNDLIDWLRAENNSVCFDHIAIEMVACYGMAVGKTVFDTCVWIGRFIQACDIGYTFIYRKDEKMNLCHSMKAKDSNITQALIDRFAPNTPNKGKGSKKEPGWFYGFKKDIWQAYAVGVTYYDLYLNKLPFEE